MGHPTLRRRWPAGAASYSGRRRHLYSGCPPALLYRFDSRDGVLRDKPQAPFLDGVPAGVRLVLRRLRNAGDEPDRLAALRAPREGPFYASLSDSRAAPENGGRWTADFLQCSALREIDGSQAFTRVSCIVSSKKINRERKEIG